MPRKVTVQDPNGWIYDGNILKDKPDIFVGFVYKITLLVDTPLYSKGTIYIGKKIFRFKKKKRLSKKAQIGTRKRVKLDEIDSQWEGYYGSSVELKRLVEEIGKDKFKREILHLCKNKSQMSYLELSEQILHKVFHVPSFNSWISCRIFKKNVKF